MITQTASVGTILNFAVVGDFRSGASVVQSSLDQTGGVVCHGSIMFSDYGSDDEQNSVRRAAHEAYFGKCRDPKKFKEWFSSSSNPYQYLTDRVFDNPMAGETRIGVRLSYGLVQRFELYELLEQRWREGDFCLIHVLRNPISCMVSARQAAKAGEWYSKEDRRQLGSPAPLAVNLQADEVVEYVRRQEAVRRKIKDSCRDALEIPYNRLVYRFDEAMGDVFEFLELPGQRPHRPAFRRLPNRDMQSRISNYYSLKASLPTDVRRVLETDLV